MEPTEKDITGKRDCKFCQLPLADDTHGNRIFHEECAYKEKKKRQKEKYKIGNSVKLMIQKNEAVAAHLYMIDKQKRGISYLEAMEQGLKFNCPTTKLKHLNKDIHMFDHFGYCIETVNGEILIFIYHESDIQ
jgi:hypothetical protein